MNVDVPKTSDNIQIKIKMPNSSHEPPVCSKAPNEDLKDMNVLCPFKIKIESQKSEHGLSKAKDHNQINIKMPNPSQEHPASSKAQNEDLNDMDVLCSFKIKMKS